MFSLSDQHRARNLRVDVPLTRPTPNESLKCGFCFQCLILFSPFLPPSTEAFCTTSNIALCTRTPSHHTIPPKEKDLFCMKATYIFRGSGARWALFSLSWVKKQTAFQMGGNAYARGPHPSYQDSTKHSSPLMESSLISSFSFHLLCCRMFCVYSLTGPKLLKGVWPGTTVCAMNEAIRVHGAS